MKSFPHRIGLALCFSRSLAASFVALKELPPLSKLPRIKNSDRATRTAAIGSALEVAHGLRGGIDFTTTVAPALGATFANAMFLSGLREVLALRRAGQLGCFNPDPMPLVFGNCLGWLTYSFLTRDKYVALSSVPGIMLGFFYSMTMLRLAEPAKGKQLEKVMMVLLAIHLAAVTACAFILPDRAAMVSLYGIINNAVLLAYYGAPLSTIGTVLKSRSADSIYFPTVLVNGLNGLFWSVYSLAIKDVYLFVPNAIGACLASIQILLCAIFGKFSPKRA